MARRQDNTVVDANTQTMRCNVCGDEVPLPLGDVGWFVAVIQAFAKAHRTPRHPPGLTAFAVPRTPDQLARDE